MAAKLVLVCIAAITLQIASGQVLGRYQTVVPNCGCTNIVPNCGCTNIVPNCGCTNIVPNCGCSNILPISEPILQNPYLINSPVLYSNVVDQLPGPTTIIQDSTVANNLANALQLLVVSNLLSNTLPLDCGCGYYPLEVPVPVASGCGCGFGGLSALGPLGYNLPLAYNTLY